MATRKASERALNTVNAVLPETIGGSADLTGSNNTKTDHVAPIAPDDFTGRYVHWGVREHGMAAAMNGLALNGGLMPYGGTFLCFSDYSRPAIRLGALMGLRVVHVMTHDSIGLGEDGPTHQPVEHLAALRAIPGLLVLRPADAVETAEAWEIAAERKGPTVMVLTRQNLPVHAPGPATQNRSRRGAYKVLSTPKPEATLYASGSEVEIAMEAAQTLSRRGHRDGGGERPLVRALLRAGRGLHRLHHRRRTVKVGSRGGDPAGLGRLRRPPGRLRRHDRLRRVGPLQGALRALRHHAEGRRPTRSRRSSARRRAPGTARGMAAAPFREHAARRSRRRGWPGDGGARSRAAFRRRGSRGRRRSAPSSW